MSGKGDTQRPRTIGKSEWDSSYQRTFTVSSSDTTLTILRQRAHERLVALTAYCNRPEYSERYTGTFRKYGGVGVLSGQNEYEAAPPSE